MKFYWFNKKCCVPECFNCSTEGEGCYKEFFDLPAEPQSRTRWLRAILSVDGENLKICEDHFKEEDIFRDKNHRKKLRLNSIPSQKLPQSICTTCLGSTRPLKHSEEFQLKMCQCIPTTPVPAPPQTSPEKRDNGCFGNEKELKNAWQYLRTRAAKVYKNEVYGTKLERKVSRFLYGKGPKLQRIRSASGNNVNGSTMPPLHMEGGTSDDEFNEEQAVPTNDNEEHEEFMTDNNNDILNECEESKEILNDNCINNHDNYLNEMEQDEDNKQFEHLNDTGNETCSESEDEYYSIEDIKNKLGIKIAPKLQEVISLISSDDSDPE